MSQAKVLGWAETLASGGGNLIVWGSLGFALILVLSRWATLPSGCRSPTRTLGEANWSFTDSWASTLTAAGVLLGAILATSGVVPNTAKPLSSMALAGLNLLFGFLVVLAPLVFSAVSRIRAPLSGDTSDGPRYQGYVGLFLAATTLTIWAVIGEFATIVVLLRELQAGTLSNVLGWLFLGLLLVTVAAIGLYTWGTIGATITYNPASAAELTPGKPAAPAARPRWNLL